MPPFTHKLDAQLPPPMLADNRGQHSVNLNLESASYPQGIQFSVPFQSPVQPLDSHPSVIDHLPLRRLNSSGSNLLVARVGVNDWLGAVLPFDVLPKGIAGITGVTDNYEQGKRRPYEPFLS